jgi:hypothetical protein
MTPVDLSAFFDLTVLPIKQLGLKPFRHHIQWALEKVTLQIVFQCIDEEHGTGYRVQINIESGYYPQQRPLEPGGTLYGRMDLFVSSDEELRIHVSGGQDVCAFVARQICNYFDSVAFRTYMSRRSLLQLDCAIHGCYDNRNPVHRYVFDDMVMRELCTYLGAADECFNLPN